MTAILDLFSLLVMIFYVYVEHNQIKNYQENDFDFHEVAVDDYYKLNENKKMLTSHTWRTVSGLAIIALIGALQALHGQVGWSAWIDMILPILLVVEHAWKGNTE